MPIYKMKFPKLSVDWWKFEWINGLARWPGVYLLLERITQREYSKMSVLLVIIKLFRNEYHIYVGL